MDVLDHEHLVREVVNDSIMRSHGYIGEMADFCLEVVVLTNSFWIYHPKGYIKSLGCICRLWMPTDSNLGSDMWESALRTPRLFSWITMVNRIPESPSNPIYLPR